jgi:hypothetical protein
MYSMEQSTCWRPKSLSHSRNSQPFMEPEDALSHSQEPANGSFLSWARCMQSISSHPISLRCVNLPRTHQFTHVASTLHVFRQIFCITSHRFDHPNNIWWNVDYKASRIQFSSPSPYFIPLGSSVVFGEGSNLTRNSSLKIKYILPYEGVSKSFRTGCLERELQMAQFSTTK